MAKWGYLVSVSARKQDMIINIFRVLENDETETWGVLHEATTNELLTFNNK
jgi:hypothetical protein